MSYDQDSGYVFYAQLCKAASFVRRPVIIRTDHAESMGRFRKLSSAFIHIQSAWDRHLRQSSCWRPLLTKLRLGGEKKKKSQGIEVLLDPFENVFLFCVPGLSCGVESRKPRNAVPNGSKSLAR